MRKLIAVVAALSISATACTPAEVEWWTSRIDEAESDGRKCPDLAPALELAGLPTTSGVYPHGFDFVVWRESRCTPTAVNEGSGALGLTQVMPQWLPTLCGLGIACTASDLLDAHTNLRAAAYIFGVQGWAAWSTG